MKALQASFSSGEISPLLHARVDLARYSTGLAELRNMIVLPQGGVTRRAGLKKINNALSDNSKLIPFEYNSTDAVVLELGDRVLRVWGNVSSTPTLLTSIVTPYSISDVQTVRYVQSGNVIFFAHRKYKPQMLTRNSLTSWSLVEFPYHGGPFINSTEWGSSADLSLVGYGDTKVISGNIFSDNRLVGTLLKLEYAIPPKSETFNFTPSYEETYHIYEVKGTLNVTTTGDWTGLVMIDRSADGGETWVTVRQYKRTDIEKQGQWDFTISETEAYILYKVKAHKKTEAGSQIVVVAGETSDATVTVLVSGFLKSEIYKITQILSNSQARVVRQKDLGFIIDDEYNGKVSLWSIGAWGELQGYPCAIAMYQDRLVFASTDRQPQTIWLSRTGDYADFSISDPLADDDAVTLTLAGSSADGIHSLVTASDLMAFTNSGEWLIRGSGDNGAITPSALTAHQQTNIGSKNIQPLLANGHVVFVQSQGRKVYVLGYDLNVDGYTGSELSILSEHIFTGKTIIGMAYQKIPDSLLWFILNDGTAAACTYNPEHEIIGWSRHSTEYKMKSVVALSGNYQTEIFIIATLNNVSSLLKLKTRTETSCTDEGIEFESSLRTLRINFNSDDGNMFTAKKLIPRVIVSALKSSEAWIAPGNFVNDTTNWERRRKINWDNVNYLVNADVQLDSGFDEGASVQIRSIGDKPLTIVGVTPDVTAGG